ncbi:MAG: hypothetical protein JNM25_10445 [Planctomycetes bacterium]|nr:hypothetical protein [Planctomycetota bacterium]
MPSHAPVALAAITLLLTSATPAQGRGRQRPDEITNRTGAFFADTQGPATEGDKVADLATCELVRAAASAGQLTVLYLYDSGDDADVRSQFERTLFANDELGIELRCCHCGRIDLRKDKALAAKFGKQAPLFVVFDQHGKDTDVVMNGYKASASSLQKALEKAAQGAIKPSLAAWAKDYGGFVRDLEQALAKQKLATERQAKAGADKAKRIEADKDVKAADEDVQRVLGKEAALLAKVRLPERPANAERLGGGRGPGPGSGSGTGGGRRSGG